MEFLSIHYIRICVFDPLGSVLFSIKLHFASRSGPKELHIHCLVVYFMHPFEHEVHVLIDLHYNPFSS